MRPRPRCVRLRVADVADITADRAERESELLMAASKKPTGPVARGTCHWCEERVPEPMRWCDAECRNSWSAYRERAGS